MDASLLFPNPKQTRCRFLSVLHLLQGDKRIQVPNYCVLPKKDLPSQPTAAAHATVLESNEEAAYIRLRGQTQDEIDTRIDYDLDSDDEKWLTNRKAKASFFK